MFYRKKYFLYLPLGILTAEQTADRNNEVMISWIYTFRDMEMVTEVQINFVKCVENQD